jgi:hypothetical protein
LIETVFASAEIEVPRRGQGRGLAAMFDALAAMLLDIGA